MANTEAHTVPMAISSRFASVYVIGGSPKGPPPTTTCSVPVHRTVPSWACCHVPSHAINSIHPALLAVGLAGAGGRFGLGHNADDVGLGFATCCHLEYRQQAAFGGALQVGQLVEHGGVRAEFGDLIAPEAVGVVPLGDLAGVDGAVFVAINVHETAAEQGCRDFELHG